MRRTRVTERREPSRRLSELAERRCRAVLEASHAEGERRGVRYAYTRPSPSRYPWQWYWDSCFAAIVWRRFEPRALARRAREPARARMRAGRLHRPHDLLGPAAQPAAAASTTTSPRAAPSMTETIQPPLLAWAWRIAVGDPAAEPRIAAHHDWLRGQPRPRGRRAAVDRAARRVRARLLAEVRPGLGPAARTRGSASRCWSRATAGSAGTRGGSATRRAGALRGDDQHALVPRAGRGRRALDHPGAGRPALGRAPRPLPRRGRSPAGARPAVSTWAALAPLALPDLPEEIGRRLVEEHLLDPRRYWLAGPAALGLGRRSRASSPTAARAGSAATGAGRPGSTPPGCCGSGCAGSATRPRPTRWPSGCSAPSLREGAARVLRPAHGRGPRAHATSPGRR